ncbi:MAG: hypothetical protein ISR90_01660 [Candidatus Marinimicrobia bacterium]|nr:hypothetical protein [Candidatus Neomarinimicrobiota bacterium]MBL7022751.1 hypothetical protein [Candidatus Neomarinimicrobiota bacterium]MBL7109611.1 hypothetical protein [Candidatus Neomarinimicrobiota bacterium]
MSTVLNYQGKLIDPLNLRDSDFDNIGMQSAVTLSRLQRFWGQLRESYSVAQHCLALVEYFNGDVELQKWGIGHEVYESLTGMDVPTPIKHSSVYLPYKNSEEYALKQFAKIYDLVYPVPQKFILADKNIMVMEAEALMPYNSKVNWRERGNTPVGVLYKLGADESEIRREFINKWQELFGRM